MAHIACIGAGNVGRAWAVVFAKAGHMVSLYDLSKTEMDTVALPQIEETLTLLAVHGQLHEPVDTVMARLQTASTIEAAVSSARYVQESVREDVAIKREVFSEIARNAPDDCILASSTSAIKGSEFLGHIPSPERALVAHPVNPPSLIPLVELCATPWTDPQYMEQARSFLTEADMKPITVAKEIDGFILNRLQYTLVAEAMHLVGEGYCSPSDIDRAMKDGLALRWASLGPFEVAHLNATQGFKGFVDQLGDMMKNMGRSARTNYEWDDALVEAIHTELEEQTPVADIPKRQEWRNARILAARKMQTED